MFNISLRLCGVLVADCPLEELSCLSLVNLTHSDRIVPVDVCGEDRGLDLPTGGGRED